MLTVGKLPRAHALEEIQIFVYGAVAETAFPTGLGECAPELPNLITRQTTDVSLASLDQLYGSSMELVEVVRRVGEAIRPVESQPGNVALDRFDVFVAFLQRVGVIETQVRITPKLLRNTEVETDTLGVPDVQVTIRFRRKAGDDGALHETRVKILLDSLADEVAGFLCHRCIPDQLCDGPICAAARILGRL